MSTNASTSATLEIARDLIGRRSVSPDDAGCQEVIADRLKPIGFDIEHMQFGEVKNLWARRGDKAPLFVFAGHTDVVPPGPDYTWKHAPFKAVVDDGVLYGRGAADMKTAIAAMTTAVERFVAKNPEHKGSIAFLLTSDEEADAIDGTVKVVDALVRRNEKMDYCVVGEATGTETVCDTMKNGRRGSLTGKLKIKGVQGHVAYPDRASNPIHNFSRALQELVATTWDKGNEFFSPTTMQFSNMNSGTGADNVIPAELDAVFNFRFSSEVTADQLKRRTEDVLNHHKLHYEITWRVSGQPFLTKPGTLIKAVSQAVEKVTGKTPKLSTSGGTSDARFIAPTGTEVIEVGLVNTSIHSANEQAPVDDIDKLSLIYEQVLENLLA